MIGPGYPERHRKVQAWTTDAEETTMPIPLQGLPPAASVEQSICLAQLQILRRLELQRALGR